MSFRLNTIYYLKPRW